MNFLLKDCYVVYRTIPTSNHNLMSANNICLALYIVLFLHQTTTLVPNSLLNCQLYIVLFLHQTTTQMATLPRRSLLYIVLFLHQTTTLVSWNSSTSSCISYYSYIKPQLRFYPQRMLQSCISYYSYIKPQLALCRR